jgi:putative ABC transport system permease protein
MLKAALFADTFGMALGTLWANKMRSLLTVVGIVIGITAIVGMTAIMRGFNDSIAEMFKQLGPDTIILQRAGNEGGSEAERKQMARRKNLTIDDMKALEREATTLRAVDLWLFSGDRLFYGSMRTPQISIRGTSEKFPDVNGMQVEMGRFFTGNELEHRRHVVVIGQTPYKAFFQNVDPIGKVVKIGTTPYTVVGVAAAQPSIGGLDVNQDSLALIPYTTFEKQFGVRADREREGPGVLIFAAPRDSSLREAAIAEIETIMRIRHGLKLNQPNDFDISTQDMIMKSFEQITQGIYLGLLAISSVALMVGGIGVMAIMMITVTERTREIGVRKALGARRREILWQFLVEAVVLTSVGGVMGVVIGGSIGTIIKLLTPLPVSMPWWSFAIGFGFSGAVGIFFGLFPAFRASRLDPIEALRYE